MHVDIIMLHIDIDKFHMNISLLDVNIYLACRGQMYVTILLNTCNFYLFSFLKKYIVNPLVFLKRMLGMGR